MKKFTRSQFRELRKLDKRRLVLPTLRTLLPSGIIKRIGYNRYQLAKP